jgi:hypothetical protein
MQQIENPVCQDHAPGFPPQPFPPGNRIAQRAQFWVVEFHVDASLTIPLRM